MFPVEVNPDPSRANGPLEADGETPDVAEDTASRAPAAVLSGPVEGAAAAHVVTEGEIIMFLQAAKGAPLSVLFALGWSGRYMSHRELQQWTRCGHKQITLALRSLRQIGWVSSRTERGPWRLAASRNLPVEFVLPESSAPGAHNDDDDSLIGNNPFQQEPTISSALREQLMEALRRCGIQEPTASRIAQLPHVTPEYIQAHVAAARAEGLRVGAAITRIEMGAPLPAEPRTMARLRQDEVEDKIRRFVEG